MRLWIGEQEMQMLANLSVQELMQINWLLLW